MYVVTLCRIGSSDQVEPDHVVDERVDGLVVGDAGADRVGQRDVARPVGAHQAGHAEQAVGAEDLGIEEIVVDPAVDDVHALRAARRFEEDLLVVDEQVRPQDQLDAHVPGEEAVLEVSGVVRPGREQYDAGRVAGLRRGDAQQGFAQPLRIILDAANADTAGTIPGRPSS